MSFTLHRYYKLSSLRPLLAQNLRRASNAAKPTKNPFPYPLNPHPNPYQIFHLPQTASESDIKARYFDLVRIYHPDKADPSVPPEEAHAIFRSITAAYDSLRGKAPLAHSSFPTSAQSSRYPTTAAWRAMRTKREALYAGSDERWKDRVILIGVVATVVILVVQIFITRQQALAELIARRRNARSEDAMIQQLRLDGSDTKGPDSRLSG